MCTLVNNVGLCFSVHYRYLNIQIEFISNFEQQGFEKLFRQTIPLCACFSHETVAGCVEVVLQGIYMHN